MVDSSSEGLDRGIGVWVGEYMGTFRANVALESLGPDVDEEME
jgi:hypothetical protein